MSLSLIKYIYILTYLASLRKLKTINDFKENYLLDLLDNFWYKCSSLEKNYINKYNKYIYDSYRH